MVPAVELVDNINNNPAFNEFNAELLKRNIRVDDISKRLEEAISNLNCTQIETKKLGEYTVRVVTLACGSLGFVVFKTMIRASPLVVTAATMGTAVFGYLASRYGTRF